jgi:hypothetical protein
MVGELLHGLGYSLQANSKTKEGTNHPDRNAQFEYLNRKASALSRIFLPLLFRNDPGNLN